MKRQICSIPRLALLFALACCVPMAAADPLRVYIVTDLEGIKKDNDGGKQ